MKARTADSVTAGLGLTWLAIGIGCVLILPQQPTLSESAALAVDVSMRATDHPAPSPVQPVAQAVLDKEQRALALFIAKRWRIADNAAARFVATAYRAGQRHSVDPLLILAVMAIESGYNPVAQSGMGAVGLMQVIPRFHLEKLSAHEREEALLDPEVNIDVGAQILREYHRRLRDEEMALQMYAGAFDEPTSQYANKVWAERDRLEPIRQRARKQTEQSV